ncbi:MAG: amino acid adenylation domain-containing protein, partial [bacterium]|nr:amino acid adenylation domain-containing protein [bacterium]
MKVSDFHFREVTDSDIIMVGIPGDELTLRVLYNAAKFNESTIKRIATHFINIIDDILSNPHKKISEIEFLDIREQDWLLYGLNETEADYPKEKTIHDLFEAQVEKTPDNIAVRFQYEEITYDELNKKSNQLAKLLRENGVKPNSIVSLMMERSVEMIIGMLAILKSGGAYLPIDTVYPVDRIRFMLEDSGTEILLTTKDLTETADFKKKIIYLDENDTFQGEDSNPENVNKPSDLAYIIYTSGTTGKPKGAMIEHNNVVRLMINDKFQFDFNEKDVWTMFHSCCFDFSVWEMYGALLYGGKLIVVPKMVAMDPESYLKLLKEEEATVLNQTPSAFYNLINEELKHKESDLKIRYIIFGGEALKPVKLKEWREKYPETKLINMYGITETTVHVTYKEIGDTEIAFNISNIGRPIPTLSTYVMDTSQNLLPAGVPGELCVGGEGVGRGYLNRPELTSEKFIKNPY